MLRGVSRRWWRPASLVVVVMLAPSVLGSAPAHAGSPLVFQPGSHPFGASYAEWTVRWWQWADSIPAGASPILDTTGVNCAILQVGPVWFLAGTGGASATRDCTIPSGRAILFPIVNINNDFPCPDPGFKPAPGQTLKAFLTDGAQAFINGVDILEVELDGQSLTNLGDFRVTSDLFQFTGAIDIQPVLDSCITGSPQLGVSDGYWIMLRPLKRGLHTLHFRGGITGIFTTEVTYNLTID